MTRRVLLVRHEWREQAVTAATDVENRLRARGIEPVHELDDDPANDPELVLVLGGDGTLLHAAELVRGRDIPLIGVNLGHVGFLAEADPDSLVEVVQRVADRDYTVEERMTIDVEVQTPSGEVHTGWAINEATIEKVDRSGVIELALGVDGRGLSSFGCDGIVIATPTGSTAYAFSGGGPIVWPDVEALLVVPIAAHALFARPLVAGPSSVLAVEVLDRNLSAGDVWCDGRRQLPAPVGSHIDVRRGKEPVRLARLEETPFSGRLVAKFNLPVSGWRGGRKDP
ncbi:NAD kinase [Georgenia sp. H159]|uniref:NAD kinase n=1 Tax=Georgenia sp. H159 TaxID=3076115 RepID=UPI002D769EF3|nr:NAD kinase [Georgenia sp. H159]